MRSKREKRLRAIRRDLVEPFYDKKDEAKLAALEAALSAPKLPVKPSPFNSSATDETTTDPSTSHLGMPFLFIFNDVALSGSPRFFHLCCEN